MGSQAEYSIMRVCFVSIDVEHDFNTANDKTFSGVDTIDVVLGIFYKFSTPATLFVTGDVLSGFSGEVLEWAKDYEIASHSYSHKYFNDISDLEKRNEIEKFVEIYRNLLKCNPRGFRAPSHVIDNFTTKILEECGFLYDSSIVPHYPLIKKYRGYSGSAPLQPYSPSAEDLRKYGNMKILEIPVVGQIFGIPLAGAWIRKLPHSFYRSLFLVNSPEFITLSIHSWDGLLDKDFYSKLEKILRVLKNNGYVFKSGEQIAMDKSIR